MRQSIRVPRSLVLLIILILLVPRCAWGQNIPFERDRMKAILSEVSKEIEKDYFDPSLKGLDWKGLTAQAKEKIEKATSVNQMVTAIFALVDKLQDSHTVFLPPGRVAKIKFGFNAKASGDDIRVYEIKKKSAAVAAGLQLGDRILSVNGYTAERNSWELMMLYFRALRPVAAMELEIARGNQPPQKLVVQARVDTGQQVQDLTKLDTIYQLIREEQSGEAEEKYHYSMSDEGIGYVQFRAFPNDTEFLDGLVNKLKNAKATIVDLRGNPGGAVEAMAWTVGHFDTEATPIADLVGRKKTETVKVRPRKPMLSGPMFVLVDSETASAGEVFARHFQLSGRAKVIGDRTSGRVLAAHLYSKQMGTDIVVFYGIEISVARVVFPGGEELEKRGVTPDVACLPTGDQLHQGFDACRMTAFVLARKALGLPDKKESNVELKKD